MKKLHVGILTYDFMPFIGGQGRVTHDLWLRLRERDDIDVSVLSPSANSLAGHHGRFRFTQLAGGHPLFSLLASRCITRWCRELQLDVLHVNGGPGGVLLLRDPGVPVVYSVFHTYEQTSRLMPGYGWKSMFTPIERLAYAHADVLVASTKSTAASLTGRMQSRKRVVVVPCGVDSDAFPQGEMDRAPRTLLFVGRLDDRKNPHLLLQAFAELVRERPDARLVFVGEGPLEARLRVRALHLGLTASVTFERFVSQQRLVEWYQRASVVVVPSVFEGFGLSAAEAQSCGACVLATDSEGLRDVVSDRETGVLTAAQPGAMAEALVALLADDVGRSALGNAAARHVREAYRWESTAKALVATYRLAVGDTGPLSEAA